MSVIMNAVLPWENKGKPSEGAHSTVLLQITCIVITRTEDLNQVL